MAWITTFLGTEIAEHPQGSNAAGLRQAPPGKRQSHRDDLYRTRWTGQMPNRPVFSLALLFCSGTAVFRWSGKRRNRGGSGNLRAYGAARLAGGARLAVRAAATTSCAWRRAADARRQRKLYEEQAGNGFGPNPLVAGPSSWRPSFWRAGQLPLHGISRSVRLALWGQARIKGSGLCPCRPRRAPTRP